LALFDSSSEAWEDSVEFPHCEAAVVVGFVFFRLVVNLRNNDVMVGDQQAKQTFMETPTLIGVGRNVSK